MGRSVSTPMANTTQSMTRCDNLQTRCPARPVSNRACSITAGEITLLRPASRSTTVSASGVGSKQLPCGVIVIASLKPGFYTHPRLQEATTCAKTNGIGLKPGTRFQHRPGKAQSLLLSVADRPHDPATPGSRQLAAQPGGRVRTDTLAVVRQPEESRPPLAGCLPLHDLERPSL